MKFLFIVQGEGRGHLTQALTLEDMLLRNGHETGGDFSRKKLLPFPAGIFQPATPVPKSNGL